MYELRLSILMPTIPERKEIFTKLYKEVERQVKQCYRLHPTLEQVQLISDHRPKFKDGGPTIGAKRQSLIERATGRYLCFLDDDEWISPDYVEILLRLCLEMRDICTFNNISKFDNYWCVVQMGLGNKENEQARPGFIKRKPWHICPVRSQLAKQVVFPESNYGEDWVWFDQVLKNCFNEAHADNIIHEYRHSLKTSQSDNVTTAI